MNTVWIVMPILIVLMFLLGTDLNRQAFANVARNPKGVLVGMVGQLVVLPVIAVCPNACRNCPEALQACSCRQSEQSFGQMCISCTYGAGGSVLPAIYTRDF